MKHFFKIAINVYRYNWGVTLITFLILLAVVAAAKFYFGGSYWPGIISGMAGNFGYGFYSEQKRYKKTGHY